MMSKDLKPTRAAWTDALRSGRYDQGTGQLRFAERYCCLGVAADLAVQANLAAWQSGGTFDALICEQRTIGDQLPCALAKMFGVEHDQSLLIRANDSGVSFDQIADYLDGFITERQLLEPPCGL